MPLTKLNTQSATSLDATVLTGNLPAISGASLTGVAGKVVAITIQAQGGSNFETSNSSYTDVTNLSKDYTMASSSNKIFFTVAGCIQRGSQDGGLGNVLEFDGSELNHTKHEDPSASDNTFLPYGSAIIDGYSGSKNFKAKIRSTPGTNKCISRSDSAMILMEFTPE